MRRATIGGALLLAGCSSSDPGPTASAAKSTATPPVAVAPMPGGAKASGVKVAQALADPPGRATNDRAADTAGPTLAETLAKLDAGQSLRREDNRVSTMDVK